MRYSIKDIDTMTMLNIYMLELESKPFIDIEYFLRKSIVLVHDSNWLAGSRCKELYKHLAPVTAQRYNCSVNAQPIS